MKITKRQLQRIIREEKAKLNRSRQLNESVKYRNIRSVVRRVLSESVSSQAAVGMLRAGGYQVVTSPDEILLMGPDGLAIEGALRVERSGSGYMVTDIEADEGLIPLLMEVALEYFGSLTIENMYPPYGTEDVLGDWEDRDDVNKDLFKPHETTFIKSGSPLIDALASEGLLGSDEELAADRRRERDAMFD